MMIAYDHISSSYKRPQRRPKRHPEAPGKGPRDPKDVPRGPPGPSRKDEKKKLANGRRVAKVPRTITAACAEKRGSEKIAIVYCVFKEFERKLRFCRRGAK